MTKTAIKLSALIITYNEERNIGRCIDSLLPVADEIIVVDSFSSDNTGKICKEKGVHFMQNKFEGHIQQKNYALEQATHEYVLSLDADEALSTELQQAIITIKNSPRADAYAVNRLTSYCGHWIRHCGWYPDRKIRLWKKSKGRWGGINPHDTVVLDHEIPVRRLKGDLLHYSYHSLSQHVIQMDSFSAIAAREAFNRGKKSIPVIHLALYPIFTFFKNYILKLGFLDGYYGFIVCKNSAYYRFLKYAKLRELVKMNTSKPN